MQQITIERTALATMHLDYKLARTHLVTTWLAYQQAHATWKVAKANVVLAVNAARDEKDKPLFSNEAVREAEITLRMSSAPETAQLLDAELDYKLAQNDSDLASTAVALVTALHGAIFLESED